MAGAPSAFSVEGLSVVAPSAGPVPGLASAAPHVVEESTPPAAVQAGDAPTVGRDDGLAGLGAPLTPFGEDPHGVGWQIVAALTMAALSGFGVRHATLRSEINRARHFATRDPLTGLANRRLFEETLARETARQRRSATSLALVLVDLDGFKHVNDTRGHAAGDSALREVAQSITGRVRTSDLPARIGGDEFAVVLPDCTRSDALRVGEQLRAQIEAAVDPTVTASIGIAVMPEQADDVDALISAADSALYTAKRGGGNRTAVAPSDAPTISSGE